MCLLLFYINPDAGPDDLYLVLVSVRDELFNRPTASAGFWENFPNVIGGKDLVKETEGGTWLAMSKSGKIGALLNILQPDEIISKNKKGRGFLVTNYVAQDNDYLKYLEDLCKDGDGYNGFLLVTMDFGSFKTPKIACYTNSSPSPPKILETGCHAFGNSITPDTPWPKVTKAKESFHKLIQKYSSVQTKNELVKELLIFLQDRTRYPLDENMKMQGKSKPVEFLDKLSAICVDIPEAEYGSRTHTIIVIDGLKNVDYFESNRDLFSLQDALQTKELIKETTYEWNTTHTSFKLDE